MLQADGESFSAEPYPRESGDPEPQAASPLILDSRLRGNTNDEKAITLETPLPPRPAFAQSPIAVPPGLLRNIAATVCSDRRDADGRLQWTTARWFDAKGPRTVSLSQKAEPQLGFATLALLATAVFAIIFAVAFGFVALIILFVVGSTLRQAKPGVTAWIDRLAAS
ncbi:MAG: hypothetical protein ABIR08_01600 [Sphingomonas sp.]